MEVVDFLFNESWEGNQDKLVGWIVVQWKKQQLWMQNIFIPENGSIFVWHQVLGWQNYIYIYSKWIIVLGANMFWDPCEIYCYISSLWNQYSLRGGINSCSAKNIAGDACAFWGSIWQWRMIKTLWFVARELGPIPRSWKGRLVVSAGQNTCQNVWSQK